MSVERPQETLGQRVLRERLAVLASAEQEVDFYVQSGEVDALTLRVGVEWLDRDWLVEGDSCPFSLQCTCANRAWLQAPVAVRTEERMSRSVRLSLLPYCI